MRGTLHLLTRAIPHRASRHSGCSSGSVSFSLQALASSEAAIERIKVRVLRAVEKGEKSTHEIQRVVARDAEPAAIRAVIKELWESGRLCTQIEARISGRRTDCTGRYPRRFLFPPMKQMSRSVSGSSSTGICRATGRRRSAMPFGGRAWMPPVSVKPSTIFRRTSSEVAIRGFPERFWVLAKDLDALAAHRSPRTEWATFLAHEDPSLKGYYETRARYIAREHYRRLFNDIGESRPAILLNGTVVGTWSLDRKANTASASLFAPLRKKQETLIRKQLDEIRESVTALCSPRSPSTDLAS